MKITYTAEEEAFAREVRAFVEAELDPGTRKKILNGLNLSKADYVNWHQKLHSRGWACADWPKEHGGTGWTPMQHFIFEHETSSAGAPGLMPFGPEMVAPVVWTFGTEEQKKKHLPGIRAGTVWWAQGYSEPNSGSDLASLRTKAELKGDHYIVNGGKTWTTLAQWADWIFCLTRTNSTGKKQEGITFLLIDMKTPGISVHPIITMEGGHEVNQTIFDNVKVPVENRIGEQDKGWTYAKFLLGYERSNMAGIPQAKRQLSRLKKIAADQSDSDGTLADNPRFKRKIADVEVQIQTLEATMLKLLALQVQGRTPGAEASYIKIRGTEIDQLLTELTMEAVGPYVAPFAPQALDTGWNEEPIGPDYAAPVAPGYFNTRKVTIYGGSNEIQKNIIAKHVLGL